VLAATRYGHFSADGAEYVVTDPRTPRPWINVIANPRVGLAVSQTGSGFSWIDNSQLGAIVRWQQDLAEDRSGRFLYLVDEADGAIASLAPAPCWGPWQRFACRHGLGYTVFETEQHGVAATWTLFVDEDATVEIWRVTLEDRSGRRRSLTLAPFLEWNCGTSPAPRREFQRLFIETTFDEIFGSVAATSHMWDVGSARWGHWNTSFPFWSVFAAAQPVGAATGDKEAFLGRYGRWDRPVALAGAGMTPRFGRHEDPVCAQACPVRLEPLGRWEGGFVLATGHSRQDATAVAARFLTPAAMTASLDRVVKGWTARLSSHRVVTGEATLDVLANDWLRYQAISGRLWARAGYYQQSGAYGFRDQLQDAQVWLTIDPSRCRAQIGLHAAHQFASGSVVHWWHPLTEQGHVTSMSDDLLWLAFVGASYLRETGDFSLLHDPAPFLDAPAVPFGEHVRRAFARVFSRTSARGLPYIGAGDWNDGLSAVGLEERGESVWLAMFLAGLLDDWAHIARHTGDTATADDYATRRAALVAAVNEHAWDGAWYRRATRDDGEWLGSASNEEGRIYLNAQTWAILNDVAPPDRAARCMTSLKEHLVSTAGALLLAPAYARPEPRIGYITRYAPGLRENGGVYSHAATWAIAAAAKTQDAALVGQLLDAMNPALKDPERYRAEPYVLPGNVDGPLSPWHGRGGWTWYTGAAAWLARVVSEHVLGVRPTWDGLTFDPCLPPAWPGARMTRPWRGARLEIEIARHPGVAPGSPVAYLDGERLDSPALVPADAQGTRRVRVLVADGGR
jgi:cellobiose phosphorylase